MLNMLHEIMNEINNIHPIRIYNEISFQIEIGVKLRNKIPNGESRIFFEKNIKNYDKDVEEYVKREIDICINNNCNNEVIESAIELKYPMNGQTPVQMFNFIKDIKFLEQIKEKNGGEIRNYFIAICFKNFYNGIRSDGIYGYFRSDENGNVSTIKGRIEYGGKSINLNGEYNVEWKEFSPELMYLIIEV
jgi:hypothetical protein